VSDVSAADATIEVVVGPYTISMTIGAARDLVGLLEDRIADVEHDIRLSAVFSELEWKDHEHGSHLCWEGRTFGDVRPDALLGRKRWRWSVLEPAESEGENGSGCLDRDSAKAECHAAVRRMFIDHGLEMGGDVSCSSSSRRSGRADSDR
jgi:hypothetical protein